MGSTRDAAIRPAHGDFVEMRRDVNVFVSLPAAWEDVPDWLRRNGNVKPTQYVRFVEQQDFTTTIREPVIRRMGCTRGKTAIAGRYARWEAYVLRATRMGFEASTRAHSTATELHRRRTSAGETTAC